MSSSQLATQKKLDMEVERLQGELATIEAAQPSGVVSNKLLEYIEAQDDPLANPATNPWTVPAEMSLCTIR